MPGKGLAFSIVWSTSYQKFWLIITVDCFSLSACTRVQYSFTSRDEKFWVWRWCSESSWRHGFAWLGICWFWLCSRHRHRLSSTMVVCPNRSCTTWILTTLISSSWMTTQTLTLRVWTAFDWVWKLASPNLLGNPGAASICKLASHLQKCVVCFFLVWGRNSLAVLIIIKIFCKKFKILSGETILSVCMGTHAHTHRHLHTQAYWEAFLEKLIFHIGRQALHNGGGREETNNQTHFWLAGSSVDPSLVSSITTPVVGLLVQGGPPDIDHILWLLKKKIPVVVIQGSGLAADLISFAYKEMEQRWLGVSLDSDDSIHVSVIALQHTCINDCARLFSKRRDISRVAKVVHGNWTENQCNWSDA